ncbi:hypothetical protein BJ085DRAFT_9066, partial [Dimargaris cristalligena]
ELVRQVMKRTNTQIDVTTASQTRTMTFLIRGKVEQARQAKRELMSALASRVTVTLQVPSFVRPFILGPRGKTLNGITQRSGTKIHIPRREDPLAADDDSNSHNQQPDEEDYDVVFDITITGDLEGVSLAKSEIEKIVNEKTSKRAVRLTHIPTTFFPLIAGAHNATVNKLMGDYNVKIRVPFILPSTDPWDRLATPASSSSTTTGSEPAITVSGEKEAIAQAVEAINEIYDNLERTTRQIVVSIPKRQHRFLVGPKGAHIQEILEKTGCIMELAPAHNASESVVIRGPEANLMDALTMTMENASSIQVDTIDLLSMHRADDPHAHARLTMRYLAARSKLKKLEADHNAQIFLPRLNQLERDSDYVVEMVTKDIMNMIQVRQALVELLKSLPPQHTAVCHVEPHTHGHLIGRNGQNVNRIHETRGVDLIFPEKEDHSSAVLLVYEGNPEVDYYIHDKRKHQQAVADLLQQVSEELVQASQEAAELVTRTLTIPSRYHRFVIGPKGATLAGITGPQSSCFVNVGSSGPNGSAKPDSGSNGSEEITIKGPVDEVERIIQEIQAVADQARQHEIEHSHEEKLSVPAQYLPHIIGKNGSNVTKLKDEHNVKIDVEAKDATNTNRPAAISIKGTKEGTAEVRRLIQETVDRLADHTVLSIHINHRLHPALIGSQGRLVRGLEDKYNVFLKFPKANNRDDDEDSGASSQDEIVIKGGRKGVEAAKAELLDLAAHEEANNQSVTFNIPANALPHIVGRSGAQVNEIKDTTQTRIDLGAAPSNGGDGSVARSASGSVRVPVTIRGTKEGIAKARKLIEAIVTDQESQVTEHLTIDAEYHKLLIGSAGSKIRDLIQSCGGDQEQTSGPTSCRVFFPRKTSTGDGANDVMIKGDKTVVAKVRAALEALVTDFRNRVCMTINIPVSEHPLIIGRGGSTLRDIQSKHQVDIEFASSGSGRNKDAAAAAASGEPVVDPTLVKIYGQPANCEAAVRDLKSRVRTSTGLTVPLRVHQLLGGSNSTLWRSIRADFNVYIDPENPNATGHTTYTDLYGPEPPSYGLENSAIPSETRPNPVLEEGTIDWVFKGNLKGVERALARCEKALRTVDGGRDLHLQYLPIPASYHRHIIGRGGANISRIRNQTGCQVELPNKRA